jgi:hypothetical protein
LLAAARFEKPRSIAAAAETDDQFFKRNLVFIGGTTGKHRLKTTWANQLFFSVEPGLLKSGG